MDRTVRCDERRATNDGLDAKTGLEYINGCGMLYIYSLMFGEGLVS